MNRGMKVISEIISTYETMNAVKQVIHVHVNSKYDHRLEVDFKINNLLK